MLPMPPLPVECCSESGLSIRANEDGNGTYHDVLLSSDVGANKLIFDSADDGTGTGTHISRGRTHVTRSTSTGGEGMGTRSVRRQDGTGFSTTGAGKVVWPGVGSCIAGGGGLADVSCTSTAR